MKCPILINTNKLFALIQNILFGICYPFVAVTSVYIASLRISLPSRESYYNSESFQNSGGRDLLRPVLLKSRQRPKCLSPPTNTTNTTASLAENWITSPTAGTHFLSSPPRNVTDTLCEKSNCLKG